MVSGSGLNFFENAMFSQRFDDFTGHDSGTQGRAVFIQRKRSEWNISANNLFPREKTGTKMQRFHGHIGTFVKRIREEENRRPVQIKNPADCDIGWKDYVAKKECALILFGFFTLSDTMLSLARVVKLVDTRDLKSLARNGVPVRFRSRAPDAIFGESIGKPGLGRIPFEQSPVTAAS